MVPRAPASRMAAGALLLLLLLIPPANAQSVPSDPRSAYFQFIVACPSSLAHLDFGTGADVLCEIRDLTYDSLQPPGQPPVGALIHTVLLTLVPVGSPNETYGWQANTIPSVSLFGGETKTFNVHFTTLPTITSPVFEVDVVANYTATDGSTYTSTARVTALMRPYYLGYAEMDSRDISKKAGQNEKVKFTVRVYNDGVYPDNYRLNVRTSDPEFLIAQPPGVYVPPKESREITFTLLTPKGTLYELGRNVQVTAEVVSTFGPGRYTAVASLGVEGAYFPVYWIPMGLVALVSGAVVSRKVAERNERHRLEKGAPRRVQPTPRQAVVLAELKRSDPEAYKQKVAALNAVYAERRAEYREFAKAKRARDREEAKQARAEYLAAKKRQKAEEKERRTLEARARKEAKIAEAAESKERKAREKQLAKARKKLEKQKAKLDKRQAKIDAKQAKIDAKAAKKAAQVAKAEAKAAAKAEKAARKAAKKGEGK